MMRYGKATLSNKLKIVTHPMPDMQSVALGIWIKVGGRYETQEYKGISHYLEHLLFKGSKQYSCRLLKESIEGVGGSLNGFTSEELTCYLVKLPHQHLDIALDILSDMVLNPLLRSDDIQKERTVILEEIKMYRDLPQSYVNELLDELLWPQQPLGLSIAGTPESVGKIHREELAAYKNKYYVPSNMVVSVAGKFEHKRFLKRVERIFKKSNALEDFSFSPVHETFTKPQVKILPKATEQTHLALGFHGLKRDHPLRYALAMLHVILGGNMSSRLFNEVREKRGLAYEIGTQVRRFHDTGAFVVHAGIDNQNVSKAIEVIVKELSKVKRSLVSESEFTRAKDFYIGQLMLALEDTLDHMLWIGETTACLDKIFELDEIIRSVARLKRADLKEVAQLLFQEEKLSLALIGPLENKEKSITEILTIS